MLDVVLRMSDDLLRLSDSLKHRLETREAKAANYQTAIQDLVVMLSPTLLASEKTSQPYLAFGIPSTKIPVVLTQQMFDVIAMDVALNRRSGKNATIIVAPLPGFPDEDIAEMQMGMDGMHSFTYCSSQCLRHGWRSERRNEARREQFSTRSHVCVLQPSSSRQLCI